MAPTKKRERDNGDGAGVVANNINGLNNGSGHGSDVATNEALAAPAAAAAALSTTLNHESHAKLNGHQQEQELFLQAFESMFVYRPFRLITVSN